MAERLTCLLVDDLEANLMALAAVLRRDDIDIVTARSGPEALEALLVHDVALALIDVQMPEMDGFELAELMRGSERTRRIPIIFVTAASREASRAFKGYSAGAVDFLYKPIDPVILESKAAVFFELHRQRLVLADELRQRNETLRLNEMFTAVLGHDLRNPLNAIMTSAYLMQRQSEDPAIRDGAARIVGSSKRMARMIEDLLDLSRARLVGGIPLQRSPANFAAVADRVIQETRTTHPDRTLSVTVSGEMMGEWDVDRLQQLMSNLIGNAVQHGHPSGDIAVSVDGTDSDYVELTVVNPGSIAPEALPSIFEPFHASRNEGLGLGLFIAHQIAQAHQGTIAADSRDDHTVFRVRLPRRRTELLML